MWDWKKAVFFGAHTDDEMICAGTLHRLVREGCEVHVVTFSPAAIESDRRGGPESSLVVVPEWQHALDLIGVRNEHRHFKNYLPSARLEERGQDICQTIYDFCEQEKPDCAFILSPEDENTAHAVVGREAERVMRGRVPTTVRCLFPWNFGLGRPNLYVSLNDDEILIKRQVIRAYKSQQFRYCYDPMLIDYATADGASVKRRACERFEIVRAVM